MFAALQPFEEKGNKNGRDEGGGDHAAEDARTHRLTGRSASTTGLDQREDAEHESERSHDDRAQTQAGSFECGIRCTHSLGVLLGGEFDNQNRIFRRQPDQYNEADLEVDVVRHAAQPDCGQCAHQGERHGHDDGDWQRPFFVLSGENQEDHDDREAEGLQRRAGTTLFLESLAGPGNFIAGRQDFSSDFLDDADGVARTDPRLAVAHHFGGDEAVEALDLFRPDHILEPC